MHRIVHFDIPADKPARAKKFYEKVFSWKIKKWNGPMEYWMVTTGKGPGINGGLAKRQRGQTVMNTISVPSVDDYAKKIKKSGGKITMPKAAIPGVGWFATFQDTEGNMLGIMQNDRKAK